MLFRIINKLIKKTPYALVQKKPKPYTDMTACDPEFAAIYEKCKPYTMTSVERMYALYKSVEYVVQQKIPGDFVECGV